MPFHSKRPGPCTAAASLAVALACPSLFAQEPEAAAPTDIEVPEAILQAAFSPTVDEVFAHVAFLCGEELAGRRSGSPGGAKAAEYLAARFEACGLAPAGEDESFFQAFERMELAVTGQAEDGSFTFAPEKVDCRNVLGWLPGRDDDLREEYILVGAHFDHLGLVGNQTYLGADDNASGTAGLLAIARAMVENEDLRPRRSVLFVAFDAEEQGLRGAEHYARHPARPLAQLVAMINLDMIGRGKLLDRTSLGFAKGLIGVPSGPALGVLGPARCPTLGGVARAVFAHEELPLLAPADFGSLLAGVIRKQAEGRADHAPFEKRKIPFLFFSNSEHDDYHKPTDTLDTIDKDALHRAARAIYRTVLAIDGLDARPVFVDAAASDGSSGEGK